MPAKMRSGAMRQAKKGNLDFLMLRRRILATDLGARPKKSLYTMQGLLLRFNVLFHKYRLNISF
jgi:hypothetical protein